MARRMRTRARAPCAILATTLAVALTLGRHEPARSDDAAAPSAAFLFPSTRGLSKLPNPLEAVAPRAGRVDGKPGSDEAASAANLGKNIIGAGVLALPAGAAGVTASAEAAGVGHSETIAALVGMFLVFGALNATGFYLIGEVCARTGAKSYQEAWSRTLGASSAWVPSAASVVCCLTGTVACAAVIGGTATDLVSTVTGAHLGALTHDALLFGVAGTVLLPLCLLPSLAPLAFASVLGLMGVCLLMAVMVFRCADGSYLPGGEFHDAMAWAASAAEAAGADAAGPSMPIRGVVSSGLLFAAVLSNAFSAHYNAPLLYSELRGPESPAGASEPLEDERAKQDAKLGSFHKITNQAFAFACVLCMVVALAGLQTFGTAAQPLILDNYALGDSMAFVARAGLGLCVLFEFPLLERCFRTTTAELLGAPEAASHPAAVAASVLLAVVIACLPGLEFDTVSAVGGALGSSFLTYVAPALMALQLRAQTQSRSEAGAEEADALEAAVEPRRSEDSPRSLEALALQALAVFGVAVGGLGVAQAAGFSVP